MISIDIAAYWAVILNISQKENRAPTSDVCQLDLKVGRYAGSAAKCSRKEMRHIAPYVTIKNMEMICATKFTSPTITKTKAIRMVINDPFTGSLSVFFPLANQLFMDFCGKISSNPMACKVRGATMIDPSAELSEAAASPMGIIGPQMAILLMINWSSTISCGVAE